MKGAGAAGFIAGTASMPIPALAKNEGVKIGYVSPQTGPLAAFAEADKFVIDGLLKATKAAGLKYEVIVKDSPNRAAAVAKDANVDQVVTAVDGQTLTLKYKDGEKKIFVAADTPIVAYVRGDNNDLKPGAKVFIAAIKQPDGTLQGRAWRIGRDGVTPPM